MLIEYEQVQKIYLEKSMLNVFLFLLIKNYIELHGEQQINKYNIQRTFLLILILEVLVIS